MCKETKKQMQKKSVKNEQKLFIFDVQNVQFNRMFFFKLGAFQNKAPNL